MSPLAERVVAICGSRIMRTARWRHDLLLLLVLAVSSKLRGAPPALATHLISAISLDLLVSRQLLVLYRSVGLSEVRQR